MEAGAAAGTMLKDMVAHRDDERQREVDGRAYAMERGLKVDFAFVKAWKGDRLGKVWRKTALNFNPMMTTAPR